MSFIFDKPINTDKLIDQIEKKGKVAGVKLKYNPNDASQVRIIFPGSINQIVIEPHSINITTSKAVSPAQLVDVYKDTNRLPGGAKIKLIEAAK